MQLQESSEFWVGEEHAIELWLTNRQECWHTFHHEDRVTQDRVLTPLDLSHVLFVKGDLLLE